MKSFVIVYAMLIGFTANAQFYKIEEVVESDRYDTESRFPVFVNESFPEAARKINTYLHYYELTTVFGKSDSNTFVNVFPPEEEFWGESGFTYSIFRNDDVFLSIAISYDVTGAYTEGNTDYFTFVAKTGEHLELKDFFAETPMITIGEMVNDEVSSQIKEFMGTIDQEVEEGSMAYEMYEECLGYYEGSSDLYGSEFYLKDDQMLFIKPRCSNHMMAALDELWEFEVSLSNEMLSNFFNQNGLDSYNSGNWNSEKPVTIHDKILTGTINNKFPVTCRLKLSEDSPKINGVYWYDKVKNPISLIGGEDPRGEVFLEEFVNDKKTGSFTGSIHDGKFEGVWENSAGTKKMPFKLSL